MDSAVPLIALITLIVFVVVAALFRPLAPGAGESSGRAFERTHAVHPDRLSVADDSACRSCWRWCWCRFASKCPRSGSSSSWAFCAVPVVVLWAASVSVVSRAGITQPLRRAVLILVLVPGALAEIVSVPLLVIGGYVALTAESGDWAARTWSESPAVRVIGLVAATAAAVAWGLVLRWLSFWVMAAPAASTFTDGATREPSPDARPY